MLESGTVIRGKYRIERLIGRGGMSSVHHATDCYTGQTYAIKEVERNGRTDSKIVEQSLSTEGQLLTRLHNPHLPRIYDILEEKESFMLVMDYVEGENLEKLIHKTGPQSTENIYHWCIQICEVFDYLHNHQPPVVYRDMKPANVMIQPDGNVMMIDFGTARTQKDKTDMSSDTVCIGTEGFAAPEQYGGSGQSDARTDIFCLGATIYNLVTGHSPCDKPKGILPLNYWDVGLAQSPWNKIIQKCTRNDPNERYQSAKELLDALNHAFSKGNGGFKRSKATETSLTNSGFQKQQTKSNAGAGLSGLLSKTALRLVRAPKEAPPKQQESPEFLPEQQVDTEDIWKRLMLISAGIAVLLLLLSAVFLLKKLRLAATIGLIFSAGAIILTITGILGYLKNLVKTRREE